MREWVSEREEAVPLLALLHLHSPSVDSVTRRPLENRSLNGDSGSFRNSALLDNGDIAMGICGTATHSHREKK